jgi:hypothetical protein
LLGDTSRIGRSAGQETGRYGFIRDRSARRLSRYRFINASISASVGGSRMERAAKASAPG